MGVSFKDFFKYGAMIGDGFWYFVTIVTIVTVVGMFGNQIYKFIGGVFVKGEQMLGSYSVGREYALAKYVYQNRGSLVAKLYNWVNIQLIALGYKAKGVTPFGYLFFWALVSLIVTLVLKFMTSLNFFLSVVSWIMLYVVFLMFTRVVVSDRIEKQEIMIMDTIDLITPEIEKGVKNVIIQYQSLIPAGLKREFEMFKINVQDRGYTFEDAMLILADQLGGIFYDFAQKAIFYERLGEKDMVDIFVDLTETNRLRRELRDKNNEVFRRLQVDFMASAGIVILYVGYILASEPAARRIVLSTGIGNLVLILTFAIIVGVMGYLQIIKSQEI